MKKEIQRWFSNSLGKDIDIAIYGHYGYALLIFPTAGSDFLEYERFNLIESISRFINEGVLKVFSINGIDNESWLNKSLSPEEKIARHQQYNDYVVEEVIPFILQNCKGNVPVLIAGASLGAFHAANNFFRRPDLFAGIIAMSGIYDLKYYTDGYFNDACYFNSPVDYLPGLNDEKLLADIRNKNIVISSGKGAYEDPEASKQLSDILHSKNIPHWLDLWGDDMTHDWPTWKKMLPYFLENINI